MNAHARTRSTDAQYIRATKTARHARAVAGLEARFLAGMPCVCQRFVSEPLDCTRVGLRESVPRQRRRARRSAARRVAVRLMLLMLVPRRAVVPATSERWHTARRRRRRPPRWLSLLSRRRFASRRRQLLRRESSEATYAPPLCGSSKERTRWQSCWLPGEGARRVEKENTE